MRGSIDEDFHTTPLDVCLRFLRSRYLPGLDRKSSRINSLHSIVPAAASSHKVGEDWR